MFKVIFILSVMCVAVYSLPTALPEPVPQPLPNEGKSQDGIHDLRPHVEGGDNIQAPVNADKEKEGLEGSESFWGGWGGWGGYRNYGGWGGGWGGYGGGWGYPYSYTIRRYFPSWRSYWW